MESKSNKKSYKKRAATWTPIVKNDVSASNPTHKALQGAYVITDS